MTTGSDFIDEISKLPPKDFNAWSKAALNHLLNGEYPSWIHSEQWVPVTAQINDGKGNSHTLTYYVSPDFISVGNDTDYVIAPLTPMDAQKFLDSINAFIPTKRMVLAIYKAANKRLLLSDPKAPPFNLAGDKIDTYQAVADARQLDKNKYSEPADGLVEGHRKNVVIGPNLSGNKVAIYGGGGGNVDDHFWQSYPGPHDSTYGDYSHAIRGIFKVGSLDGNPVDITQIIFPDKILSQLVSDQGVFAPTFPNAGAYASYSTGNEDIPQEQYSSVENNNIISKIKSSSTVVKAIGIAGIGLLGISLLSKRG